MVKAQSRCTPRAGAGPGGAPRGAHADPGYHKYRRAGDRPRPPEGERGRRHNHLPACFSRRASYSGGIPIVCLGVACGHVRVRRCVRDGKVHRVRQVSLLTYSVYFAVAQVKVKLSVPGKADHAHSAEGGGLPHVWPAHPPTVLRSPQIPDSLERRTVPPSPPPMTMCTPARPSATRRTRGTGAIAAMVFGDRTTRRRSEDFVI